jgi:hypothetical protein
MFYAIFTGKKGKLRLVMPPLRSGFIDGDVHPLSGIPKGGDWDWAGFDEEG